MCTPSPFYSSDPIADHGNKTWRHAVAASDFPNARRRGYYLLNLIISNLRLSRFTPVAQNAIRHVVGLRSNFQMVWINASRIVALVPHNKIACNWTVADFIRKTVRPDEFAAPASKPQDAITTISGGASPKPAIVDAALVNFCPKPINNRYFLRFCNATRTALRGTVARCALSVRRDFKANPACQASVHHQRDNTHVFIC